MQQEVDRMRFNLSKNAEVEIITRTENQCTLTKEEIDKLIETLILIRNDY